MMKSMTWFLTIVFLLAAVILPWLTASGSSAPTSLYYVDAVNGSDATGTGSQANPWKTITHALAHSSGGDTLYVMPGLYNQAIGEVFPIQFKPGVSLVGSGTANTVLSAPGASSVIYIGSKTVDFPAETQLADLTVQDGEHGIEIYTSQGRSVAAEFTNIVAKLNTVGFYMNTGGVYENGGSVTVLISDTQVIQNTSDGIYMHAYGYFSPSTVAPTIVNSRIESNARHGLFVWGEAVSANGTNASPHLSQTLIAQNGGDGIHNLGTYQGWAKPVLDRSFIQNNAGYGFYYDMGVNGGNVAAQIMNSVIADNTNGGVYIGRKSYYSSAQNYVGITNSNLVNNGHYGIHWFKNANEVVNPVVLNTILWNVGADDLFTNDGVWDSAQITYSDIEDGDLSGVAGNFSADPIFVDSYHVLACSPVRDAGLTTGAPPVDMDGEGRPVGASVDVGVDELSSPCALMLQKTVSAEQAYVSDTLVYTITLSNVITNTIASVLLTDTLPVEISYLQGTLWASHGTPNFTANTLSWSDDLDVGEVVTIGFQADILQGNTSFDNRAYADLGDLGKVFSAPCTTFAQYHRLYLPGLFKQYCSGIVRDDFSDPASGWPSGSSPYWDVGYQNGEYRVFAKGAQYFVWVTRGDQSDRFGLEVSARQASVVNGSFGLMFGLTDDGSEFYTFEIYPAQQAYAVIKYSDGNWSLLASNISSNIQAGSGVNRLRIAWKEQSGGFERYEFRVNSILLETLDLWTTPAELRRVGLTATSDAYGFEAHFDDYLFSLVNCLVQTPTNPAGQLFEQFIEMARPDRR